MKKLLRRFHDMSLSRKMILGFSALLLMVCLIMLSALNISFGIYDENLYEKSVQSLDFFARQVNDELEDVENFTYELAVSTELQLQLSQLKNIPFNTADYYYGLYQLRLSLLQEVRTHAIVKNIRFIDTNGNETLVGTDTGKIDSDRLLQKFHDAKGAYWVESPSQEYPYLVGGRDIRRYADHSMEYLGSCIVTCDAADLIENQINTMASSYGVMYVVSGETIVYSNTEEDPPSITGTQGYKIVEKSGQKQFVCWLTDETTGWLYLNVLPYTQIFGQTRMLRYIVATVFLMLFAVGFLFIHTLARLFTSPLEQLNSSVQMVENDNFQGALAMLPDHPYLDETGQLTSEFRVMLQRIDNLIEENYKKQLLLRDTRYKMLQAQINPHFLNNTLNTVSWMIRAGRNSDATRVVVELGQLLHAALSREEKTSIAQEIQLVKSYITIQEFRYHGRASFCVQQTGELDVWTMPKMILQPLVENAILHAVENSLTACEITVKVTEREKDILLQVHNTGPSMTEERLLAVRKFETKHEGHGIGLKNIYDRLKLYFGEFEWKIESSPENGTLVHIGIPKKGGESKCINF